MAGTSLIGQAQAVLDEVAENLTQTAQGIDGHLEALRQTNDEMEEAMGDSHQDTVPEQQEVVQEAIRTLEELSGTAAECSKMVGQTELRL